MKTDKTTTIKDILRERAEKTIGLKATYTAKDIADASHETVVNLIHELQVNQIELEMQNDELRRTHDELEYTRHKYSHLYDFAPTGYITKNEKGIIEESNLTMAYMLGVVRTDLIGKIFTRLIHKEDQDIFYKHRLQLLETKAPQSCELRLIKKDSQPIYVRLEAIIVSDEKSQDQIRVIVSDINEHKRIQEAFERERLLLRKAEQISDLGAWEWNIVNDRFSTSENWQRIHGVSTTEMSQNELFTLAHPEDVSRIEELSRKVLTKDLSIYDLDHRIIRKNDGEIRYVHALGEVVFDNDDKPIRMYGTTQDITQQKRAEAKLKDSEEYYRGLFNSIRDAILIADTNRTIINCNPAFIDLFGYSKNEISGKKTRFVYENDEQFKELEKALSEHYGDAPFLKTANYKKKNGEIFPGETGIYYLKSNNETIGFIGLIRDTTDRKVAENELRRTADRLLSAQRIAQVGDWEWEPGTDTVTWSEQLYRIFELDSNQPPPKYQGQLDLYHPKDAARLNEAVTLALEQGTPYELEMCRTNSVGRIIHLLARGVADRDKSGKVLKLYGSVQDITTRKQIEDDLREGRAKLKAALDSMSDAVFISDANGHFIEFNEAFATFHRFGNKKDCIEDLANWANILDVYLLDGTLVPLDIWVVTRALRGETAINSEFRLQRRDTGDTWFGSYNYSPIFNEDGKIVGSVTVARDITETRKFQSQLQQAQKMESIGTLAGGIAHDFNNILFPIVGHTEMLLEDISADSPLRDSLNEIYTGSLRARDLVQQILAFSRQGKSELKLMKMQPIIKEALKLIRSTIPTTISINQNLQPDCGPVNADPTHIHQIVMNLATNAYHAMEETEGELKISLNEVELGQDDFINPDMPPGSYACLTMTDTGTGMDKKNIDKIFDPFFTTKEKGKGTGMGLSVVHGIVKSMNGEIQVYSEPGKGTQFHIYLPIVKSDFEKQETLTNEPIQGGTESVLLVDDEEGIIAMEKLALERLGYQVTSRTSSIEVLETFRTSPDKFDLVITDMAMPNLSGDKLAIELIKIRFDIPILLCTGFSESMPEEKIKSLGIRGLLLKPIIIRDLAKKIREILDKYKNP